MDHPNNIRNNLPNPRLKIFPALGVEGESICFRSIIYSAAQSPIRSTENPPHFPPYFRFWSYSRTHLTQLRKIAPKSSKSQQTHALLRAYTIIIETKLEGSKMQTFVKTTTLTAIASVMFGFSANAMKIEGPIQEEMKLISDVSFAVEIDTIKQAAFNLDAKIGIARLDKGRLIPAPSANFKIGHFLTNAPWRISNRLARLP